MNVKSYHKNLVAAKKIHTFAFDLIIQTIKQMEKKTHYTCKAEHKTGCLHRKADIQRHPD